MENFIPNTNISGHVLTEVSWDADKQLLVMAPVIGWADWGDGEHRPVVVGEDGVLMPAGNHGAYKFLIGEIEDLEEARGPNPIAWWADNYPEVLALIDAADTVSDPSVFRVSKGKGMIQ